MQSSAPLAWPLLQLGVLMGIVLIGNAVAVRHLPLESVPGCLQGRIELSNRLRPWLSIVAMAITAAGLVLHLV